MILKTFKVYLIRTCNLSVYILNFIRTETCHRRNNTHCCNNSSGVWNRSLWPTQRVTPEKRICSPTQDKFGSTG